MTLSLPRVRLPQRRKDILRRPRLLDTLHRNIHRKLTFISAPAGYGKTALLLDFAADLDARVYWYSIAPEHNDLVFFVQHLTAAFQQTFPPFGRQITPLLENASDPYSLATAFNNEIVAHVADFSVLILDDFHLVGEVQAIASFIENLLENLPDQVRLLCASRSVYGIPSAALYVRDDFATLGTKELRFRANELQALVRQNYRTSIPNEQAAMLAELADGWIVALLLAARSIADGTIPKIEGATEHIYAFLADEVLQQQSPLVRDMLFATAILEGFDETVAGHMLNTDGAAGLLQELIERNLFISQVETTNGHYYQYHQLFAEFLQNRLWQIDPERARALHQRAAGWYLERENWEAAIRHLLAAGDRLSAAGWMDRLAPAMFLAGHNQLLNKWYESLSAPPSLIEYAPRLALHQAKIMIDQNMLGEEYNHLLDIAEAAFRKENDTDLVVDTLLARAMAHKFKGQFEAGYDLAYQAESLLGQTRTLRWYQTQRIQGICLGNMGDIDEAIRRLDTAAAGFRMLRQTHNLAETLNDLGNFHLHQKGAFFQAQSCFLEVLDVRRKTGNSGKLATALNNSGYLYHQIGRYKEAWRAYEEALRICDSARFLRTKSEILSGKGDLLRDLEEWGPAREAYETARQLGEQNSDYWVLAYTFSGLAELERLRGNYNEAFHCLREAARCRKEGADAPLYQLGLGSIYLKMDQIDLAIAALAAALDRWGKLAHPTQEQALAEFLLAEAYLEQRKPKKALDSLNQALRHAAQLGYDQFLVVAGRSAPPLLHQAAAAWQDHTQLRSLIQRVENFRVGLASLKEEPAIPAESRRLRLDLLALGEGAVRRDGELLPASSWISRHSRALFFLIADKGEVKKEEIALEFWPDFSPEKVSSNFHSTLWRVRRAVGDEVLIYEDERYRLAPAVDYWYDVAEFEAYLKRSQDPNISMDERLEAWRQAAMLYRGDYLASLAMDWIDLRRTQLQKQYLQALLGLAGWETQRKRFNDAIDWYERAITIDPYHEDAEAGILKCLLQQGALADARSNFLAYKQKLATDLGLAPPRAIQELFQDR